MTEIEQLEARVDDLMRIKKDQTLMIEHRDRIIKHLDEKLEMVEKYRSTINSLAEGVESLSRLADSRY